MGKRVDFSGRGSFTRRAMITVLQWSRGADWMLEFMALCKIRISDTTLRFVLQLKTKASQQKKRWAADKLTAVKQKRKRRKGKKNSYYGNVVESSVEIERLANNKKAALKMTVSEIEDAEDKTNTRPVKKRDVGGRVTADNLVDYLTDDSKKDSLTVRIVGNKWENDSKKGKRVEEEFRGGENQSVTEVSHYHIEWAVYRPKIYFFLLPA
jgi:hypothetical protein